MTVVPGAGNRYRYTVGCINKTNPIHYIYYIFGLVILSDLTMFHILYVYGHDKSLTINYFRLLKLMLIYLKLDDLYSAAVSVLLDYSREPI